MKKNELIYGVVLIFVSILFSMIAIFTKTKLDGIFFGLSGGFLGVGALRVYKYFYWHSSKHSQKYQEMVENEEIEKHDELKVKIRNQAGRYAYLFGIYVNCAAIMVFRILGELKIIENTSLLLIYLFTFLLGQITFGIIVFYYISNKYK